MQRIFKYGDIRNISLTPNKEPNILITFLHDHIQELYTLKNCGFYWATMYVAFEYFCITTSHKAGSNIVQFPLKMCGQENATTACTSTVQLRFWIAAFLLPGQFTPWSESSNRTLANSLPGTSTPANIPWNFRSLDLSVRGTFACKNFCSRIVCPTV